MHIKRMHDMIEKLTKCAEMEFEKGVENVDTKEMGEVVDIIKDLSEAEYYAKISKAMDEAEYGEDYDYMGAYDEYDRKGYRGQPRDSRGRYMSRRGRRGYEEPIYRMSVEDYKMHEPEYWRDLDRVAGRMYYTDGNMSIDGNTSTSNMGNGSTRGYSENDGGQYSSRMQREGMNESRYDRAKRAYTETKEMNKDKGEKMKNLEEYMKELSSDVTSMISDMTPEEKTLIKQKMSALMQKI